MSLEEVRDECEVPTVAADAWFADHQLKARYTSAACRRASVLEQRRWFATAPCDELRRRLFHDVPYHADIPSNRALRLKLWTCEMSEVYFDRLDLEQVVDKVALMTSAMSALSQAGHPVVDTLLSYLSRDGEAFGKFSTPGGIYNGFRGIGLWLARARPARCLEVARGILPAMEADARAPAENYRGVNGIIQGLLEGRCYEAMSLLAAREVAIRVVRARADGRTSELTRCRWLGLHGTPEGRSDMEKVFANADNRAWIEAHSPNCLFALDKVRAPRPSRLKAR